MEYFLRCCLHESDSCPCRGALQSRSGSWLARANDRTCCGFISKLYNKSKWQSLGLKACPHFCQQCSSPNSSSSSPPEAPVTRDNSHSFAHLSDKVFFLLLPPFPSAAAHIVYISYNIYGGHHWNKQIFQLNSPAMKNTTPACKFWAYTPFPFAVSPMVGRNLEWVLRQDWR